jgi:hypothetical protein
MRISTPDSLWLRPEATEGKESAMKVARKKGEIMFAKGSG